MKLKSFYGVISTSMVFIFILIGLSSCGGSKLAPASYNKPAPNYIIGAGDNLNVFVWRNPELTTSIPVRPDGRFSMPLIDDMQAAGKTPSELGKDVEKHLKKYLQDPIVTVIVTGFVGPFEQQIRVVGEASNPQAIPYSERMTALDVMIAVGGLTEFASGNRAKIIRQENRIKKEYRVKLDDLIKDGDISANVDMLPGDILIIPQSFF